MKKTWIVVGLLAALIVPAVVQAQGPGGGGGGARARNSPKRRLTGLVRAIGELEKGNKAPLTKDQAKKVLALVAPWRKRPKMTEDQAKALYMKMNAVLTTKQKNELDKMAALRRRNARGDREGGRGGFGGGGFGGGGGQPPSPQQMQQFRQQMQKMQGFLKTYNPFYPPGNYRELKDMPDRMRQGWARRHQATVALLASLAKKARS